MEDSKIRGQETFAIPILRDSSSALTLRSARFRSLSSKFVSEPVPPPR